MADKKVDENLDLGEEKESGSKKMIILMAVGGLLLLLTGVGISYFLFAGGEPSAEGGEEAKEEVVEAPTPAIYHALKPEFTVNLPPGGKARMMQLNIQVMSRDQSVIDLVAANDPMVRHTLLNIFGSQDSEKLRDRKGKEALQTEILNSLNKIVKEQEGTGEVEAVFFTSFVMQ
ncbi:MAG: flagellar basal body-associated FliL family protein [Candidatus Sedimenticola sp. (ex Thyasira tokunagai)]